MTTVQPIFANKSQAKTAFSAAVNEYKKLLTADETPLATMWHDFQCRLKGDFENLSPVSVAKNNAQAIFNYLIIVIGAYGAAERNEAKKLGLKIPKEIPLTVRQTPTFSLAGIGSQQNG